MSARKQRLRQTPPARFAPPRALGVMGEMIVIIRRSTWLEGATTCITRTDSGDLRDLTPPRSMGPCCAPSGAPPCVKKDTQLEVRDASPEIGKEGPV